MHVHTSLLGLQPLTALKRCYLDHILYCIPTLALQVAMSGSKVYVHEKTYIYIFCFGGGIDIYIYKPLKHVRYKAVMEKICHQPW